MRFIAVTVMAVFALSGCQSNEGSIGDPAAAMASTAAEAESRAQVIWDALTGPDQDTVCKRWNMPPSDDWQYMDREAVAKVTLEYALETGIATPADNTSGIQDGLYKVLVAECG